MIPECEYFTADDERYSKPCVILRKKCVTTRPEPPSWISVWDIDPYDSANSGGDKPQFAMRRCYLEQFSQLASSEGCCAFAFLVTITNLDTGHSEQRLLCLAEVTHVREGDLKDACIYIYRHQDGSGKVDAIGVDFDTTETMELKFWEPAPYDYNNVSMLVLNCASTSNDLTIQDEEPRHYRIDVKKIGSMSSREDKEKASPCSSIALSWAVEKLNFACCSIEAEKYREERAGHDTSCPTCFKKWILTVEDAACYAMLVGQTRDGRQIVFEKPDWDKDKRQTFTLVSRDAGLEGFPTCVCVAPLDTYNSKYCQDYDEDAQCNCCLDFNCGGALWVSLCGRLPRIIEGVPIDDAGLLNLSPMPPYKCTAYAVEYNLDGMVCAGWYPRLLLLAWCDGTEDGWHVWVYCRSLNGEWVFQEDAIDSVECRCGGAYLEYSLKNTQCVCCCPEQPGDWPNEFNVEMSAGLLCGLSCNHGVFTGTITRVENTNTWMGNVGELCGNDVELTFTPATPCENAQLTVRILGNNGQPIPGCPQHASRVDCACGSWLFTLGDMMECATGPEGPGPCFLSFSIYI
jgi:hypothetical protein